MPTELDVFAEALTISDTGARTEFLDRVCGEDKKLRLRVGKLLGLHDSSDSVLDRRPAELIESLSDGCQSTDASPDPSITLAALKPYLEPATQLHSLARLSHYELLEILGQGGYGIVFKAFDTKLTRMVAIKILSPQLAMTSPPRRRFLREARAAAAVRHENVSQIYAVEESPIPYLVMELIVGETLQQRSERLGPLEPIEVVRLGQQIARGLAAAHAQSLVHRDIKPANILIQDGIEPVAKLSDFGLARTADDASKSQSGAVIGTPMYMSPEQVAGVEVDQRTDLFSFGSVLYLMTAGRPPFRAPSTLAVLKRVAEDKPRSIRDVIPDAPRGLCAVITRLHAKAREDRFSTATEVEAALADCLNYKEPGWLQRLALWGSTGLGRAAAVVIFFGMAILGWLSLNPATPESRAEREALVSEPVQTNLPPAANSRPDNLVARGTAATDKKDQPPISVVTRPSDVIAAQPVKAVEDSVELSDWDKAVGMMPIDNQTRAVELKLKELNPQATDLSVQGNVVDGLVKVLWVREVQNVADISPIRALRHLTELLIVGHRGKLTDLSPLKGMKLTHFEVIGQPVRDISPLKGMPIRTISLWMWLGDDLSPLRGMPIIHGNFGGHNLRELEPLRGMKLEMACFNFSQVSDLSPLRGMPLTRLEIANTQVTDLTPIANMQLDFLAAQDTSIGSFAPLMGSKITELNLNYDEARDRYVLEALPGLRTVNNRPVAEVLAK